MCKAKLQVAGILAMLLYHMFFIIVILPSSISRSRTRLSLWIDERQIASFFGKSIFCICKNDNLSQFFFHIYIKTTITDVNAVTCIFRVPISRKTKMSSAFTIKKTITPFCRFLRFLMKLILRDVWQKSMLVSTISLLVDTKTFPNTTYSSMLQGEKKNPKNRVSRKKNLWAFFDYFTLAVPIVSKALRKCFPPLSELKVPGSNLDRFSLFIFYDGEVSWYFSCVYTYPIFFFLYDMCISMRTNGESSVNSYRRAQE